MGIGPNPFRWRQSWQQTAAVKVVAVRVQAAERVLAVEAADPQTDQVPPAINPDPGEGTTHQAAARSDLTQHTSLGAEAPRDYAKGGWRGTAK